ncbi:MAG: hypothetical protein CMJ52_04495 [Planctomycetaceae bacterium]|nr:hypothetical protein [Planctomycetaceae bacterium]
MYVGIDIYTDIHAKRLWSGSWHLHCCFLNLKGLRQEYSRYSSQAGKQRILLEKSNIVGAVAICLERPFDCIMYVHVTFVGD